jgi:hypothetical protein
MHRLVELNLALILFLPWFVILGVLYWVYPRQPRPPARKWLDVLALLLAVAAFVAAMHWGHGWADPGYGPMWRQIVATAVSYAAFLGVLTLAFCWRARWLRH